MWSIWTCRREDTKGVDMVEGQHDHDLVNLYVSERDLELLAKSV